MPAGAIKLKIHDREFKRYLAKATATGLKRAAVFYHTKCRQEVSKPNTGTRHKGAATTYDNSSKEGEPPRLRTGFGRSQIIWEYNDNKRDPAVRVGVGKAGIYMIFLELGTRTCGARPWLVATLMKYKSIIGRLAATGGKHGGG